MAVTMSPQAPIQYNSNLKSKNGIAKQNARIQGQQLTNQVNAYNQYIPDIMAQVYDSINAGGDLYKTGVTNQMATTNNAQNLAGMGMTRALKGAGIQPGSTGHMQALNNLFSKYAVGNSANLATLQQQEMARKQQARQLMASLVSNGSISAGDATNSLSQITSVDPTAALAGLAGQLGAGVINKFLPVPKVGS
jgi:hypothetical protein